MTVAVITDTVACLPSEMVDKYQVTVIPLEIVHEGKVYRDGIDMTSGQFYSLLATSKTLPTTTAASPETYLQKYKEFAEAGKDILVLCPSTALTHVFGSATVAAKLFREQHKDGVVEVLDTGTAAGAQGLVVADVAAAASEGKKIEELLKLALERMKHCHVLVAVDTLKYLARSGRVPNLLAMASTVIDIKPIIELLPLGKGVIPVARVRTMQRAMDKVIEIARQRTLNIRAKIVVQHTNAEGKAAVLAEMIKTRLDRQQADIWNFTPVMGVHTGPGLIGVSYCTYDT